MLWIQPQYSLLTAFSYALPRLRSKDPVPGDPLLPPIGGCVMRSGLYPTPYLAAKISNMTLDSGSQDVVGTAVSACSESEKVLFGLGLTI